MSVEGKFLSKEINDLFWIKFIMNDLTASVHGNMMEAIFSLSA